jgi:pyruvate/2-oxoglutarate/acetoin dehydrogenase E1 component
MKQMYLNRTIAEAVKEEMQRDEDVILIGEDIINRGGGMSIFMGISKEFPERCLDMPIAELGYSSFGVGASMGGLRPVVDLMFSDFATLASAAIIGGAAKYRFYSQGEVSCPVVFTMANGGKATFGGVGSGANHSQCTEAMFMNFPGLKILAPYYPEDVKGLLKAAIRDNDPVLFFYHEGSLGKRGQVPEEEYVISINDAAKIRKEGSDVTIIAVQSMVPLADKAAEELKALGISAEVIDPRVLVPLDKKKIIASVKKTGRAIIVHEAHERGGIGAEISAVIAESCVPALKAPIIRLGAKNIPISSGYIEELILPHAEDIVKAAQKICK